MTEQHDDIVDLEQYAKEDRVPPRCRAYRIRIDRERYVVHEPCLTGREILELAAKKPTEFQLFQKFRSGEMEQILPDTKVDFTRRGIERFVTLPLDQTEGSA
jgi:hypothetical protein